MARRTRRGTRITRRYCATFSAAGCASRGRRRRHRRCSVGPASAGPPPYPKTHAALAPVLAQAPDAARPWVERSNRLKFVCFGGLGRALDVRCGGWNCDGSRRSDSNISQVSNHFEDFAAGWKHPPAGPFVGIERVHEFDFVIAIVAFASGRIDLAATLHLHPPLALFPSFSGDRHVLLAPLFALAAVGPVAALQFHFALLVLGHCTPCRKRGL